MMLELDEADRELLERIVRAYLADLREEVYKTDTSTFKDGLKEEERRVRALLDRLS